MNKTTVLNSIRTIFKFIFIEKILFFFTSHKAIKSLSARLPANYYQYPKFSIRKVERDGICYELDISDYMEWLIYFGIQVEPREKLYSLVKNAKVIFDIGANVGETTLNFANKLPSGGIVHSFEPSKECFEKLTQNINLNKFKNIKINNFGLGENEGRYFLQSEQENNNGGNRIRLDTERVPNIVVKRLDNYVKNNNITHVDLIKIDVEGFEFNVLKGAEKIIDLHKPVLFIELDDDNLKQQDSSAKDLLLFLEEYYKNIINAETQNKITSNTNFEHCHYDIICRN